ncbi:MAG TPA: DUF6152 family protein [Gammaproteobacteria bacterium]|nr:DUF6152 family protein [Gammaproteobacteria bacterium]
MPWKHLAAASVALATSMAALAHHSHANYDVSKWTVVEGTVKQVVLIAPHSIVYLDVKNDAGATATWALEATAPVGILNNGVKREDVRAGDPIQARCHRLRDGANGCLLGFITPLHGDAARGHGIEREWD